jgi:alpha-methylacyl-CoA racemase
MLDGIRVLDLASVGPAARASRWLADYGATVIKVGPVAAQGSTQITPDFFAYGGHRGMKRILLDLKMPEGVDAFLRLAGQADVLIESFRPGVMDRLGVGHEKVRAANRRLIYCSTTGFGQDGPQAQWAGHDLNYLGSAGFLDCSGRGADGQPPIPGATVADSAAGGMQAVMSILAALVGRATTQEGTYLDVSVADGMLAIMALQIDEYLATGVVPGPGHGVLTGRYACYDTYQAADKKWLSVAAIEPRFWANLCRLVGLERWASHQLDDAAQDRIRADLREVFSGRDRDDWVSLLAAADTCVAPVLTVPEVVVAPQFVARGAFVEAEHPREGTFRQVGPTLAGMARPSRPYQVRDAAVTDTDELLAATGCSSADIALLREKGAVA